ncbi:hypothetical protein FT643_11850 [Ketobacter sp. MCCC 1A13808]|uniref:hypothetical protein n=1 Tax=Ketobacter sp. MCCC 1A13808 TaxID=2602738 RepID=UPI0012EBBCB7|nr:hypothetical protein [Ketobacter sp. MCCC 1A13808]MVF12834.1 hypothetical protein [Ketobacter sp. MCCC 1A13808]
MTGNFVVLSLLAFWVLISVTPSQAEMVLDNSAIGATENAVVMPDGRYFVAGDRGIFEIKRSVDISPDCFYEAVSGLTTCLQVAKPSNSRNGFFSGLTTDGEHLYAAYNQWNPFLLLLGRPAAAAFYKILPGTSAAARIQIKPFENPVWYNGMVTLDSDTLLLSASQSGTALNFAGPAIVRLTITDHENLHFELGEWLSAGPGMLLPNGLVKGGESLYFVGGQSLFRVNIDAEGNAGEPTRIYKTGPFHFMDDLTLSGDTLAVTEFSPINGLVKNYITLLDIGSNHLIKKIPSDRIQLSSLAVDQGLIGNAGDLIGTSYFQGGIHVYTIDTSAEQRL